MQEDELDKDSALLTKFLRKLEGLKAREVYKEKIECNKVVVLDKIKWVAHNW